MEEESSVANDSAKAAAAAAEAELVELRRRHEAERQKMSADFEVRQAVGDKYSPVVCGGVPLLKLLVEMQLCSLSMHRRRSVRNSD